MKVGMKFTTNSRVQVGCGDVIKKREELTIIDLHHLADGELYAIETERKSNGERDIIYKSDFKQLNEVVVSERKDLKGSIKEAVTNGRFSDIFNRISKELGIKPQPFKIVALNLFRLGNYRLPNNGSIVDLSEYFIDEEGSLYSRNNDTYVTGYGSTLEKLSDDSTNSSGNVINTLRAKDGTKVTIRRQYLKALRDMGQLEDVTNLKEEQAG